MKRPDVVLDNYKAVYDYYRQLELPARPVKLAYAAFNGLLHPRVSYANRAEYDLERIRDTDMPHIYAFNHLSKWDQFVVGGTLHQIAPDDVGNMRSLGADFNFRWLTLKPRFWIGVGPLADYIGGVPVYRHMDYTDVSDLTPVHEELFDAFADMMAKGQKVEGKPEGKINETDDPATLLKFRSGLGGIAHRAATLLDTTVAITPGGMAYGRHKRAVTNPFHTSVTIGESVFVTPDMSVDQITYRARAALQYAVTLAHDAY